MVLTDEFSTNYWTAYSSKSAELLFGMAKVEILNLILSKDFYIIKQMYWVYNIWLTLFQELQ